MLLYSSKIVVPIGSGVDCSNRPHVTFLHLFLTSARNYNIANYCVQKSISFLYTFMNGHSSYHTKQILTYTSIVVLLLLSEKLPISIQRKHK